MNKLSVLREYIRDAIAKYKKHRENAILWKKHPERMLNLAAADMIEEMLDDKKYCYPFNTYMCIALRYAKVRKDGRTDQVRERAKSFIMFSLYPENTLFGHLNLNGTLSPEVFRRTDRFINEHGIPYYRELVTKIRKMAV
ncbi:hypothetical protein D3C81_229800 [compost metagenome]